MSDPKIHILNGKEVHLFGHVAVVWNTRTVKKSIKGEDGIIYTADVPVRNGKPYIDFISVREKGKDAWEDDDGSIDGGLNLNHALIVYAELGHAIEYLKKVL